MSQYGMFEHTYPAMNNLAFAADALQTATETLPTTTSLKKIN
jgi:hypothetical protein